MLEKDIPKHIAIIMDGNGRWAKKRGLHRTEGHRRGIKVVEDMIEEAARLGIKVLSLYAFSTENWIRPKSEINMLFRALDHFLSRKTTQMIKNNIKLRTMGDVDSFPASTKKAIIDSKEKTKHCSGLIVNLALNYGSRPEILNAVKEITKEVLRGAFDLKDLNEEKFSQFLYTKDLLDPDLLIRTSGEVRLSNFMLWQLSYAELYFCKKFWPDFTKEDLKLAIEDYQNRERRFGDIDARKKIV